MKRNQVVKIADTETDMCVISVGKKVYEEFYDGKEKKNGKENENK